MLSITVTTLLWSEPVKTLSFITRTGNSCDGSLTETTNWLWTGDRPPSLFKAVQVKVTSPLLLTEEVKEQLSASLTHVSPLTAPPGDDVMLMLAPLLTLVTSQLSSMSVLPGHKL